MPLDTSSAADLLYCWVSCAELPHIVTGTRGEAEAGAWAQVTQNGQVPWVACGGSPCARSEGGAAADWILGQLTWGHSRAMGTRSQGICQAGDLEITTGRSQKPSLGAVGPPCCPLLSTMACSGDHGRPRWWIEGLEGYRAVACGLCGM